MDKKEMKIALEFSRHFGKVILYLFLTSVFGATKIMALS